MHQGFLKGAHVPPTYATVVDQDRKYVHVSESFGELGGYKKEELIGTRYDHLTALNTTDIQTTSTLFDKIGTCTAFGCWFIALDTAF
jgi:PAS domain S-box-containing protein